MARRPCSFKESDISRLARAVKAAGLPVYGIMVDMMRSTLTAITDKDSVKTDAGEQITDEDLKKI